MKIELNGRAVPGGLYLNVHPEISTVIGFVEEAPIVQARKLTSACMVKSRDWIVLGGLNLWSDSEEKRGLFNLFRANNKQMRDTLILIHAVKMQPI